MCVVTCYRRLNPLKRVNSILTGFDRLEIWVPKVSIPSSGSIQFLPEASSKSASSDVYGLNPLKRVNSILTSLIYIYYIYILSL